jgi:DNA-binding MarR family transcriptional regulator
MLAVYNKQAYNLCGLSAWALPFMPSASTTDFITTDDDSNESLMIHDIARLSKIAFDRKVRTLNLTRSQWQVLSIVRRHPGINQVQLAERLEVKPITVARTLDRLEKAGWLERKACKSDRRVNQLYLTQRVQNVVTQMRSLGLETRQCMLDGVTQEEHAVLLSVLLKIKQNLCQKSKVNE